MKTYALSFILLAFFLTSCTNKNQNVQTQTEKELNKVATQEFQNKGHELVYNMAQKVGNYSSLAAKNNVSYTYTYTTPDGKSDVSNEKYIFDGEYSYGKYEKHERTLPQLKGIIEQGYNGKEFWLKHNGEILLDEGFLKRVAFNRPTNFYWFTMMQKLLDPGLKYEFLREESINGKDYNIVKITFESNDAKPKDIYQLYINKQTNLVDQFLFTVADFGKMDPKLMQLEYEEVDGIMIPSKRRYKNSTWEAEVSEDPWIDVRWSDIKFDVGITKADFSKDN